MSAVTWTWPECFYVAKKENYFLIIFISYSFVFQKNKFLDTYSLVHKPPAPSKEILNKLTF